MGRESGTHGRMAHWGHDTVRSSIQSALDHPFFSVWHTDNGAGARSGDGVVELVSVSALMFVAHCFLS